MTDTSYVTRTETRRMAAHLSGLPVYALSGIAECGSPDSLTSPGAEFLTGIRDALVEAIEQANGLPDEQAQQETWEGAPNTYTHAMWSEFVDLCAYEQDLDDWAPFTSIEDAARSALKLIARALVEGLLQEVETA